MDRRNSRGCMLRCCSTVLCVLSIALLLPRRYLKGNQMSTYETVRVFVAVVLVGLIFTPMVLTVIRHCRECFTFYTSYYCGVCND
jgi:hypothetical protein